MRIASGAMDSLGVPDDDEIAPPSPLYGVSAAAWRNRAAAKSIALERIFSSSIDENDVSVADINFDLLLSRRDPAAAAADDDDYSSCSSSSGNLSTGGSGFRELNGGIARSRASGEVAREEEGGEGGGDDHTLLPAVEQEEGRTILPEHAMKGGGGEEASISDLSALLPPPSAAPPHREQQQTRRRRREEERRSFVRFHSRVKIRKTLSLRDMTQDEIDGTWMTPDDKNRNEREMVRTIDHMRRRRRTVGSGEGGEGGAASSSSSDSDGDGEDGDGPYCYRGLEHMRHKYLPRQRRQLRRRVVDAVLDEQERQWTRELHNSREIARTAGALSSPSKGMAIERAAADEAYTVARRRSSQLRSLRMRRAAKAAKAASGNKGGGAGALGRASAANPPPGGEQEDGNKEGNKMKRRRSSGLSFEKHGDAVLNKLAELADRCLDREDEEEEDGAWKLRTNGEDDEASGMPVITRIEEGIIRREIDAGNIQRNRVDSDSDSDSERSGGRGDEDDGPPEDGEIIDAMEEEEEENDNDDFGSSSESLKIKLRRRRSNDGNVSNGTSKPVRLLRRRSSLLPTSGKKREGGGNGGGVMERSSRRMSLSFTGMRAESLRSLMGGSSNSRSTPSSSSSCVLVVEEEDDDDDGEKSYNEEGRTPLLAPKCASPSAGNIKLRPVLRKVSKKFSFQSKAA